MKNRKSYFTFLGVLGVLGLLVHSARAVVPAVDPLTFTGRLTNNGAPLNDTLDIRVEFYPDDTASSFLCATGPGSIAVSDGYFRVPLEACKATLRTTSDLWLGVSIGGVRLPRSKVGAVPYALESAHSTDADNAVAAASASAAASGSNLDMRLNTNAGDVTALQGRVTSAETRLAALETPNPRVHRTYLSQTINDPCRGSYNNADSASPPVACFRLCESQCISEGYVSGFFNGQFVGGPPDLFGCTCMR